MSTPPFQVPDMSKYAHKEVSPKESTALGLEFAMDLGFLIAVPAVLFGVGGALLDKKLGTGHLLLFLGLLLAFVTSGMTVYRKVQQILARMPKDLPPKKLEPVDTEISKEQELLHELFRPPNP